MSSRIRAFGVNGMLPFSIVEANGRGAKTVQREVWFDQDIDGRWLVCAAKHRKPGLDGEIDETDDVGAIVVTNAQIVAFIEMLADLVLDPAQFHDEPRIEASSFQA